MRVIHELMEGWRRSAWAKAASVSSTGETRRLRTMAAASVMERRVRSSLAIGALLGVLGCFLGPHEAAGHD